MTHKTKLIEIDIYPDFIIIQVGKEDYTIYRPSGISTTQWENYWNQYQDANEEYA